jgi:tetratricopeptide (TPR) repeat protein
MATPNTDVSSDTSLAVVPERSAIARPVLRAALGVACIVVLVFAAYWPVLRGEFIWDDPLLVDSNPLVTGKLGLSTIWFQTDFPLTSVAFWLQRLAWGNNATGYHIVNVALHAIDACLVWAVLARLGIRGAWLAAALFAVHPVGVGTAGWISEQKNTLSLLFYLASFWLFLKDGSAWIFAASLCAFVLALLTKTSTVALPIVLLFMVWWRKQKLASADAVRVVPFFVLAVAFGLMTVWFQSHEAFTTATVQTEGFWGRLASAGRAVWFYLGKVAWPFHLSLIYPRWQIDPRSILAWVPLALLIAVGLACWRFRNGWGRHLLFVLGAFVAGLFPVLGYFDMYYLAISRVSDHFQYLPMIAPIALIAAGLTTIAAYLPNALRLFAATALVLGLAGLTFERARVFAVGETLWRDTLARNPTAWTAQNNLGCILAQQNHLDEAEDLFAASLRLNPNNPGAHCNYGRALLLQGAPVQAEDEARSALKLKPESADAHTLLARILVARGKPDEAVMHLRMALRVDPNIDTSLRLASLLGQTGHGRDAVAQFRKVLAARPNDVEALNNMAWILATDSDDSIRDGKEAVQYAKQACERTHYSEAIPIGTLGAACAEAGQFEEAAAMAQKAIDLATAEGKSDFAQVNRQLLSLYKASRPYHEQKKQNPNSQAPP